MKKKDVLCAAMLVLTFSMTYINLILNRIASSSLVYWSLFLLIMTLSIPVIFLLFRTSLMENRKNKLKLAACVYAHYLTFGFVFSNWFSWFFLNLLKDRESGFWQNAADRLPLQYWYMGVAILMVAVMGYAYFNFDKIVQE